MRTRLRPFMRVATSKGAAGRWTTWLIQANICSCRSGFSSEHRRTKRNREQCPSRSLPGPHQRSLERAPVDVLAGEVHAGDAARVADVVERIGVEHQEVGALARRDDAAVSKTEELRRAAGCRD